MKDSRLDYMEFLVFLLQHERKCSHFPYMKYYFCIYTRVHYVLFVEGQGRENWNAVELMSTMPQIPARSAALGSCTRRGAAQRSAVGRCLWRTRPHSSAATLPSFSWFTPSSPASPVAGTSSTTLPSTPAVRRTCRGDSPSASALPQVSGCALGFLEF